MAAGASRSHTDDVERAQRYGVGFQRLSLYFYRRWTTLLDIIYDNVEMSKFVEKCFTYHHCK